MFGEFGASECKQIFDEARRYLLSFDGIDEAIIERHLDEWRSNIPKSLEDVFYGMLDSVRNRQGMPNAIGEIDKLQLCLYNFNPRTVIKEYENDWRRIFTRIKNECPPPGQMDVENPRSYWVIFCKSIVSAANFLSRYSDLRQFNTFVETFYLNEHTRVALPLLLEKEVFGMGFALACDFLKENGYPKFIKPDVHIKAIFSGIGLSKSDRDYDVFKDVVRFSETIDELPYRVDKMFWLIGSGNFYLNKLRIRTNRDEFTSKTKKKLLAVG
jgi:hypothetical protein